MKKFVKLLAFVIDMVFLPVRFIVGALTLVCGCIVHEWNLKEAIMAMIETTVNDFKIGFKPTIKTIFKD